MNYLQKDIIGLVGACLGTQSPIPLSQNIEWQRLISIGKAHHILPMLFYGAKTANISLTEEVSKYLNKIILHNVLIDNRQLFEIKNIFNAFEKGGIEYMPLKGCNLKMLYPKSEMRPMGDADILIKTQSYDKIKGIMTSLGFTEIEESNHELIWDKPGFLHVELHKSLVPSYDKDFYAYYGDGWSFANKCEGKSRHDMTAEDELVYIFAHMAKHYRDGGIGIRHITDIYVFLCAHKDIDDNYLYGQLNKLRLLEFYKNVKDTIDVWFEGKEPNKITDTITDFVFSSGAFGHKDSHIISTAVRQSKEHTGKTNIKTKNLIAFIFPPLSLMKERYPFLNKVPFLLPFMWPVRWLTTVLFKRQNIKEKSYSLKKMSDSNISEYQAALNLVGLDYNFGEEEGN